MSQIVLKDILNDLLPALEGELREAELTRQRLERFTQFFNRVNSAFSFRKIVVKVENSSIKAPAWSNASEVIFNSRVIGELNNPRALASIRGINLHELSHIIYTPREGSEIVDYCREHKLHTAFNILEDCRIETFFTTRYPSTITWFTATIAIFFDEHSETFKDSYPLLRGRKYLPVELRARSRNLYSKQEDLAEIDEIVDTYRLLVFPTDTEKGIELVERFNKLLPKGDGTGDDTGDGTGKIKCREAKNGEEGDVIINCPFGHGKRFGY